MFEASSDRSNFKSYLAFLFLFVLVVIVFFFLSSSSLAEDLPPKNADWIVDEHTTIADTTIDLNGNLTIKAGGSLTLGNITLIMGGDHNGHYGILVENGGKLMVLEKVNLTKPEGSNRIHGNASQGNNRYTFVAEAGSEVKMVNTKVQHCGYEDVPDHRGMTVKTDDVLMINCTFSSNYMGVIFDEASSCWIRDSQFSGNSRYPVWINRSNNVTVSASSFSGGNAHGVMIAFSEYCNVTYSDFHGFSHQYLGFHYYNGSGVHIYESKFCQVQDCESYPAWGARGFWIEGGHHNLFLRCYVDMNRPETTSAGIGYGAWGTTNNTFKDCYAEDMPVPFFVTVGASYNTFDNCSTFNCIYGMVIGGYAMSWNPGGDCDYNVVKNCLFEKSVFHGVVIFAGSDGNHIVNNVFVDRHRHMYAQFIDYSRGMILEDSNYNILENNHFDENADYRYMIQFQDDCNGNIVKNQTFGDDAIYDWCIVILRDGDGNIVENCTFHDKKGGIVCEIRSSNNIFRNNVIFNANTGISIEDNSYGNTISGNTIYNISEKGISIFDDTDNSIFRNRIENNILKNCSQGIYIELGWATEIQGGELANCDNNIFVKNSNNLTIDNVSIDHSLNLPFDMTNTHGINILNFTFSDMISPFKLLECSDIIVSHVLFQGNDITIDHMNTTDFKFIDCQFKDQEFAFNNNNTGTLDLYSCLIYNNTVGIQFNYEGSRISKCIIEDTVFSNNGHALMVRNVDELDLYRCTFENNTGFGAYIEDDCQVSMLDPIFINNREGGLLAVGGSKVDIRVEKKGLIQSDNIVMLGNWLVGNGAVFEIKGSDIGFLGNEPGESGITIDPFGTLLIDSQEQRYGFSGKSILHSLSSHPFRFLAKNDSTVEMVGTTISGCGFISGSVPDLSWGAAFYDCDLTLKGCTFQNSECGLVLWKCDTQLEGLTFKSSTYWGFSYGCDLDLLNCTFLPGTDTNQMLWSSNSQITVKSCSFPSSDYRVKLSADSSCMFADTIIYPDNIQCIENSRALVRYNYKLIFRDVDGYPFSNLSYRILDAKEDQEGNGSLNDQGETQYHFLTSYVITENGLEDIYNPHGVLVELEGITASFNFNVLGPGERTFTINLPPMALVEDPEFFFYEGGSLVGMLDLNKWFQDEGPLEFEYFCTGNIMIEILPDGKANIYAQGPDWFGTQEVIFTAMDQYGLKTSVRAYFKILPVNDAPTLAGVPNIYLGPGDKFYLDLSGLATDIDTPYHLLEFSSAPQIFSIEGKFLVVGFIEGLNQIKVTVSVFDGNSTASTSFNVYFQKDLDPLFLKIPDQIVYAAVPANINLSQYFNLSAQEEGTLIISTSSEYITLDGKELILNFPDDVTSEKVFVFYRLGMLFYTRSFNVSVIQSNAPATILDHSVSNVKKTYTFNILILDAEGDLPEIKVFIDGESHLLAMISGDILTGAMFSKELDLSSGEHTYYFQVGSAETQENSLTVSENEEADKGLFSSTSDWPWWVTFLIIVICFVIIILSIMTIWKLRQKEDDEADDMSQDISVSRRVSAKHSPVADKASKSTSIDSEALEEPEENDLDEGDIPLAPSFVPDKSDSRKSGAAHLAEVKDEVSEEIEKDDIEEEMDEDLLDEEGMEELLDELVHDIDNQDEEDQGDSIAEVEDEDSSHNEEQEEDREDTISEEYNYENLADDMDMEDLEDLLSENIYWFTNLFSQFVHNLHQ